MPYRAALDVLQVPQTPPDNDDLTLEGTLGVSKYERYFKLLVADAGLVHVSIIAIKTVLRCLLQDRSFLHF